MAYSQAFHYIQSLPKSKSHTVLRTNPKDNYMSVSPLQSQEIIITMRVPFNLITPLAIVSSLPTLAFAHGIITSPPSRQVGAAMKSVCGEQVCVSSPSQSALQRCLIQHLSSSKYHINSTIRTNNLQSNPYGDIQQLNQISTSQKDFTSSCDVTLCKGLQFEDNNSSSQVQVFTPGQTVPFTIDIQAKHTGVANVSVVNTKTNTMIGTPILNFPVYASTSTEIPKNQTSFDVKMPDMGSSCGTAGDCVVQWWWDSPESKQTYMSCVDFTM